MIREDRIGRFGEDGDGKGREEEQLQVDGKEGKNEVRSRYETKIINKRREGIWQMIREGKRGRFGAKIAIKENG